MPTAVLEDFRKGLDTRKGPLTGESGSLQTLQDCVINQGGEVEKRLAFVPMGALPAGSFGLFGQGTSLHVFAQGATGAGVVANPAPDPVVQEIMPYTGTSGDDPITYLYEVQVYKNEFWLSVATAGGVVYNFFNGGNTDAVAAGTVGKYARVFKSKMYRMQGPYLRFSTIDNPGSDDNTDASPGGGFIDVSANDVDSEDLVGIEVYYSFLALFARRNTQIWSLDPDPSENSLSQVIRVGTIAPKSVLQYQTGDVLFLSDSGIRSLRALNYTLAAGVIDLGSPVDALVKAQVAAVGVATAAAARAVVEPITGRYWLAIGQQIFVLSYFPSAKISAWSVFTTPFVVEEFAVLGTRLYVRDTAGNLYLYGGADGATYDTTPMIIRTPYSSLDKPSLVKKVNAVSAVCFGNWAIGLGMDATNVGNYELIATTFNSTITQNRGTARGTGTHMSLEFVCADPSLALLCSASIDFVDTEKL